MLPAIGLALSGAVLVSVGLWILLVSSGLPDILSMSLVVFGIINLSVSISKKLSVAFSNMLALAAHLFALTAFYLYYTRFLNVAYSTDSIIATYMGILKVLQLQNPYLYSIKPFLDQFGLSPSHYTPRVNGSFEFHLNYPALNFLSLLPMYLAGLHDLRDGVLSFHILSLLIIYRLVPPRFKALSLAPFAILHPLFAAESYTDGVWAFFLLSSAVLWYKDRRTSLVLTGLAGAFKQIALLAVPFLLIRMWHETRDSKPKSVITGLGIILTAFFVPNIPFILASPQAWWVGIVAPYLPSDNPQILGGVGLSGILANLGIVPPAVFFFIIMGLVGGSSIYIYSGRFRQTRYFLWAMPILILFFYHRSFPNYFIYWLFPFVFELARYQPISFPRMTGLRLKGLIPRSLGLVPVGVIQKRAAPTTLIVLVLAIAFVGASGTYISIGSQPKVDVQVTQVEDPDSLGVATLLNITLTNLSSQPVTPKFFVMWSLAPYLWVTNSSEILAGKYEASYLILSPDTIAAIPSGATFRVFVFDSTTGHLVGQTGMLTARVRAPSITNPHFRWWTLDGTTGRKTPFGWRLSASAPDPVASAIVEPDRNQTAGVRLKLNYTSSMSGPAELVISQKTLFNSTQILVLLSESFPTDGSAIGKALFGTRISDGTHILYYVFSSTASKETVNVYPQNVTVTVPVSSSALGWVQLDALAIWNLQGWTVPAQVELAFFLKATATGVYYADIGQIRRIV